MKTPDRSSEDHACGFLAFCDRPSWARDSLSVSSPTSVTAPRQLFAEGRDHDCGRDPQHAAYIAYPPAGFMGRYETFSGDTSTSLFKRLLHLADTHPITPDRIRDMRRILDHYCRGAPGACR